MGSAQIPTGFKLVNECQVAETLRKFKIQYQVDNITASAREAQVWRAFSRRDHLTVKQLFRIIKRTDNTIGLNYVYYVMGKLRRAGVVTVRKHRSETYYDKAIRKQPPELLICQICGAVQPVVMLSPEILEDVARTHDFRIEMHKLEIEGWCKICRRVKNERRVRA